MIKVKINYDNDYIKNIKITGHAGYDVHGKDIVCASVSSIAITSINLILRMDEKNIKVEQKEGLIDLEVLNKNENINLILVNMVDMLKELSNEYEKYVKII